MLTEELKRLFVKYFAVVFHRLLDLKLEIVDEVEI